MHTELAGIVGTFLRESSLTHELMSLAGMLLEGISSEHAGKTCGDT